MYGNIQRGDAYIERLSDFIRREYGISAISVYPANRGFYGETWKLSAKGRDYFIKLVYPAEHRGVYESSFPVIDRINHHGIDFISRIVKTVRGKLSAWFDGAVLGVFDWIEGESRQDESTKIKEYQMLAKVYTVPAEGLNIRREDFSAGGAELFFTQYEKLKGDPSDKTAARLIELFEQNREKIEHRAKRLRYFSNLCKTDTSHFYITHGDAGGNVIVSPNSSLPAPNACDTKYHLVDWDTPIHAPPERDAWFCMSWAWAMDAFHNALRQNGVNYILRQERLAYYCYHMFFFYLNAYLDRFTHTGITQGVEEYMDCWIEESFQFADTIQ